MAGQIVIAARRERIVRMLAERGPMREDAICEEVDTAAETTRFDLVSLRLAGRLAFGRVPVKGRPGVYWLSGAAAPECVYSPETVAAMHERWREKNVKQCRAYYAKRKAASPAVVPASRRRRVIMTPRERETAEALRSLHRVEGPLANDPSPDEIAAACAAIRARPDRRALPNTSAPKHAGIRVVSTNWPGALSITDRRLAHDFAHSIHTEFHRS